MTPRCSPRPPRLHTALTAALIFSLCLCLPVLASAQSIVTFQLDLSDEITNGIFNPELDGVEIRGDRPPLSNKDGIPLQVRSSGSPIYAVRIEFPRSAVGKELRYRFALMLSGSYQQENPKPPRRAVLTPGKKILKPAQFQITFQLFDSQRSTDADLLLGSQ